MIFRRVTDEIEALKAILLDDELNIKENDKYILKIIIFYFLIDLKCNIYKIR